MYEVSFLFHLVGGKQNPPFIPFLTSRPEYPILAICLGAQTLNVAAGGTLVQDIPGEIYGCQTMEQVLRLDPENIHSSTYTKKLNILEDDLAPAFHRIRLKGDSIFVQKMDMKESDHPYILTSHHQAVEGLGRGLVVTATSMDGRVVEAVAHIKFKNVLGVQFHPEYEGLFRKGRFFKRGPGESQTWNLRRFLLDHPPSMKFHQKLWQWFARALRNQPCRRRTGN
jgi:putative glutamine amidotransferase